MKACALIVTVLVFTQTVRAANDGVADAGDGVAFADGAGAFGTVFGAWTFTTTSGGAGQNGFFTASSTNNGAGGGAGIDSIFDPGPPGGPTTNIAWGVYANSGQTAVAYRPFSGGSLGPNQAFELQMDNGNIDAGGYVGFVLRTGNITTNKNEGQRFEFLFAGGDATYKYIDATGVHDTGLGFTSGGMGVRITVYDSDFYELRVNVFGEFTTHLYAGTLGGSPNTGIDSFAFYNQNAGGTSANDAFFNKLVVTTVPVLGITGIEALGGTNAVVSFQSSSGGQHELQTATDLTAGSWTVVTNFPGTGGIQLVNDWFTASESKRFYKVKTSY